MFRFMKQVEHRLHHTPIAPYEHFPLQEAAFQFARGHIDTEQLRPASLLKFEPWWPKCSSCYGVFIPRLLMPTNSKFATPYSGRQGWKLCQLAQLHLSSLGDHLMMCLVF